MHRVRNAKLQRWIAVWGILGLSVLYSGCSKPGVDYAPVSGRITIDGAAIEGARIVLVPDQQVAEGAQPVASGTTDADGRFVLKTLTPEKELVDGAVVGPNRATVATQIVELNDRGAERVIRKEMLGPEYTNGGKLSVDVPAAGLDALELNLQGK
ncbi:MAG: carboxypeptidase regulatory-like domain-containing protein [Planctomycetales bacterium]|nr:carboxypeptidase regulatory-like domain-containing protein [Planctomycetales bacterium]